MKSKKKNTLTLVMVLVLGLTLFTAATVAAGSTNVGYETFKATMETMNHKEATTGTVQVSITDNGDTVMAIEALGASSEDHENFSAQVDVSDGTVAKSFDIFGQDDTMYLIDTENNGYYQMAHDEDMKDRQNKRGDDDRNLSAVEEELLDYFVGDLKDNFSVDESADGSKTMNFKMEATEVPTGLNLMIKAAASAEHRTDGQREKRMEGMPFMDGFDLEGSPDLTKDVQLNLLEVTMNVNDEEQVNQMTIEMAYSGLDEDGEFHEVTINVDVALDYAMADVSTIDTDAYDWELIEHNEDQQGRHRR